VEQQNKIMNSKIETEHFPLKWYVLVTVLDQTIGFYSEDTGPEDCMSDWTVVHRRAKFYGSREDAEKGIIEAQKGWKVHKDIEIEEVDDLEEFCAREDTW
jgi:hypothetical protein